MAQWPPSTSFSVRVRIDACRHTFVFEDEELLPNLGRACTAESEELFLRRVGTTTVSCEPVVLVQETGQLAELFPDNAGAMLCNLSSSAPLA
mmetsp:Transcript_86815/g.136979  ORF Transcript_86815/g.136979 Transcript_86815/m.136979 type:complete len:92 (+) Transcript_86815:189-464(+)